MSDSLLLTGATGFLGMELIARWLDDDDGPDVFVAVRDGTTPVRVSASNSCWRASTRSRPPARAGCVPYVAT